ncbi:MAG: hypothetical protein JRL30_29215 [Deltaproteobacteria bacterium]|nr:hypothetical protein [Deltaproteobacteria bacterium]
MNDDHNNLQTTVAEATLLGRRSSSAGGSLRIEKMNEFEIENKIAAIYKAAGFPLDKMDVGITLMKMSETQLADLSAMIDYLQSQPNMRHGFIAAQVGHDLGGLKAEFINGPCGFSPRSTGYAKLHGITP